MKVDKEKFKSIKVYNQENNGGKNSWVLLELTEGKNREIRRVFAKNNVEIRNLKRISIGSFSIENMKIGQLSQINSD